MFDRHAIASWYVLCTFEVLGAPESDVDGVILTICGYIPRILDVQLQPDAILVEAQDVPVEVDRSPGLEIIGRDRDLEGIQQLHLLVVLLLRVCKPHDRTAFLALRSSEKFFYALELSLTSGLLYPVLYVSVAPRSDSYLCLWNYSKVLRRRHGLVPSDGKQTCSRQFNHIWNGLLWIVRLRLHRVPDRVDSLPLVCFNSFKWLLLSFYLFVLPYVEHESAIELLLISFVVDADTDEDHVFSNVALFDKHASDLVRI